MYPHCCACWSAGSWLTKQLDVVKLGTKLQIGALSHVFLILLGSMGQPGYVLLIAMAEMKEEA